MIEKLINIIEDGIESGGEISTSVNNLIELVNVIEEYKSFKRIIGNVGCLLLEGEIDYALSEITELEEFNLEKLKIVNKLNSLH